MFENDLITLAQESTTSVSTGGGSSITLIVGIITVLITSITAVIIAFVNRKEAKDEKKRAEDPETKKKLEEAEQIKEESRRTALLESIGELIKKSALQSQVHSSDVHVNTSRTFDAITKAQNVLTEKLYSISVQIKDLHKWHDKEDNTGAKVWYSPREEIKDLATALGDLNNTMVQVMRQIAQLEAAIKLLNAIQEKTR